MMRPEDRGQVLRLWKENMTDPRVATVLDQRFDWLYEKNPLGPPVTVVAFTEHHEAVGSGSAYPRRLSLAGAAVDAAILSDFVVDKEHRIGGAALLIQRALIEAQPAETAVLVAYPNEASMPIFKRIGYEPVGGAYGWVKPLRAAYKLKRYVRIDALAGVAAFPVDTLLASRDATRAIGAPSRDAQILDRADDRFDRLWASSAPAHALSGERSSAYLNWRYGDFTTTQYRFFCVFNQAGELVSYLVFSVSDAKAFVVDAFAGDMEKTIDDLLIRFARAMRQAGHEAIFVQFVGDHGLGERLKHLGYYSSGEPTRQLFTNVLHPNDPLTTTLKKRRGWYMFDGEMDI
jgi:hypothetical protein